MTMLKEKMLILQSDEKSVNYRWYDEYAKTNLTDIKILSINDVPNEIVFSDGQSSCLPQEGKCYIRNPFKRNEYVEENCETLKKFEHDRLNLFFSFAHKLGATEISFSEKTKKQIKEEKGTMLAMLGRSQKYMKKMGLDVESFSFEKKYKETCLYGPKEYELAKQFMKENCLEHDGDFKTLLEDRNPEGNLMTDYLCNYSFRKFASNTFNLALNFEGLATALNMTTPLSCLLPTDVKSKVVRKILVVKDLSFTIKFGS